jgi:hypothetical protein
MGDKIINRDTLRAQCEASIQDGIFSNLPKAKVLACQTEFPDEYVADSFGRRKVKTWYVERTWQSWAKSWMELIG